MSDKQEKQSGQNSPGDREASSHSKYAINLGDFIEELSRSLGVRGDGREGTTELATDPPEIQVRTTAVLDDAESIERDLPNHSSVQVASPPPPESPSLEEYVVSDLTPNEKTANDVQQLPTADSFATALQRLKASPDRTAQQESSGAKHGDQRTNDPVDFHPPPLIESDRSQTPEVSSDNTHAPCAPKTSNPEARTKGGAPDIEGLEWARDQLVECFDIGFNLFGQIADSEQHTDVSIWMETWHMSRYLVNRIIEVASAKPEALMDVAINLERDPRDISKLVHTCLLAINTGIGLGYHSSRLLDLGISALLHDIGMFELPRATQQAIQNGSQRLTKQEMVLMRQHTILGVRRLKMLLDTQVNGEILAGIYQHHERIDGSGYPDEKKESEIHEFAQIIGVANAYEAMTHAKQKTPHEAMCEIIGLGGKSYSKKITRTFVNQAAIFPVGSLILLENEWIGKVISSNTDYPLRPVLLMLINHRTHQKTESPYRLDLAKNMSLNIRQSINPDKIGIDPVDILYATVNLKAEEKIYVPSMEDLEARSQMLQREVERSPEIEPNETADRDPPSSVSTKREDRPTASKAELENGWLSIKSRLNQLARRHSKQEPAQEDT